MLTPDRMLHLQWNRQKLHENALQCTLARGTEVPKAATGAAGTVVLTAIALVCVAKSLAGAPSLIQDAGMKSENALTWTSLPILRQ